MSELAKAVCAVMAEVSNVKETGKNQFHKYAYASDEDLLRALQPAMARNGLCLLPVAARASTVEHTPDHKGKAQWRTDLSMQYRLYHVSGEYLDLQMVGCGLDGEDKGAYKALTGALKYVMRQTFLVPTGDDPEKDREDRGSQARSASSQPHGADRPNASRNTGGGAGPARAPSDHQAGVVKDAGRLPVDDKPSSADLGVGRDARRQETDRDGAKAGEDPGEPTATATGAVAPDGPVVKAEWKDADRKKFFAQLNESGVTYDGENGLKAMLTWLGRPGVSELGHGGRNKLLAWVRTEAFANKYREFLGTLPSGE